MTVPAGAVQAATVGAGAPPDSDGTWEQINWDHVTTEVTRLQARIAKATLRCALPGPLTGCWVA
jgi:hypothetical protein